MGIPGVTLCFQFVSIAISLFTAAAMNFASRIKTVCATPSLYGEKESIGVCVCVGGGGGGGSYVELWCFLWCQPEQTVEM